MAAAVVVPRPRSGLLRVLSCDELCPQHVHACNTCKASLTKHVEMARRRLKGCRRMLCWPGMGSAQCP